MKQNETLLCELAWAAKMGKDSVSMLMKKTDDAPMRRELMREMSEYAASEARAKRMLFETCGKRGPVHPIAQAGAWLGIQMETLRDRTPSHLADTLIQGSTMGVIDMTRARARCPEADPGAHQLANEFLKNGQESIERLKRFL